MRHPSFVIVLSLLATRAGLAAYETARDGLVYRQVRVWLLDPAPELTGRSAMLYGAGFGGILVGVVAICVWLAVQAY
jgi:hypothetical protein